MLLCCEYIFMKQSPFQKTHRVRATRHLWSLYTSLPGSNSYLLFELRDSFCVLKKTIKKRHAKPTHCSWKQSKRLLHTHNTQLQHKREEIYLFREIRNNYSKSYKHIQDDFAVNYAGRAKNIGELCFFFINGILPSIEKTHVICLLNQVIVD